MKLYIIRHAIAVEPGTPGYDEDSQRPLTPKGSRKMRKIARGLKELEAIPDLILSSPYRRAAETANILADILKLEGQVFFSEHLAPLGFADQLIAEINEKYRTESLALVGHEPSLSSLASLLVSGNAEFALELKKGGVCCLDVSDLRPGRCATLLWLMTPAQLAALGG
ncbi:MAG: phosphohistidine phosphatase SixA [Anaerolineales bacterium]